MKGMKGVYENAMMVALKADGHQAVQQMPLRVHYEGVLVGDYVADIIVERAVLIEIKATEENAEIHVAQVLNYLKATNLPEGLLLNYGRPRLRYRRLTLRNRQPEDEAKPQQ